MANLAVTYRPKTFEDLTEQSIVSEMLSSICNHKPLDCRNFLLVGPAGTGKASPLDSNVLTPNGYIPMRDVQIGTYVYTHTGAIAQVSGIYPQGIQPVYRITLNDRTSIRVSKDHLNLIYTVHKKHREYSVITTEELIDKFNTTKSRIRVDIPVIDWADSYNLPVSPYLLGLLIGHMNAHSGLFFVDRHIDVVDQCNEALKPYGGYLLRVPGKANTYQIISDVLPQLLENLGIIKFLDGYYVINREIPTCYLYTTRENRILLFQGLFDTLGRLTKGTSTSIRTCDKRLSKSLAFLVRSLGIRDTVSTVPLYYHISNGDEYTSIRYNHYLHLPRNIIPCKTSHHLNSYAPRLFDPMRHIVSIEYVGEEECQCIMVDHPDHTYISDDFIPTHNTTSARIMSSMLNDGKGTPIEIDAASHSGVDAIREIIEQARTYPVGCEYKVFIVDECHSLSNQAWQSLLKTLEENPAKSVFILCTTNPEKIPATILSRVQTFQLSKISLKGIESRLKYVIERENAKGRNITYTDDAINYLAKMAQGGMRDALTLLDKALTYSLDITSENLAKSLNLPKYDDFFSLLTAYVKHDNATIASIVNMVYNSGVNFVKWFAEFHSFVMNIVKYIYLQDINQTMIPAHYQSRIQNYSNKHVVVCLKLANKLMKLNSELKTTPYLQEVALTYLCSVARKDGD